MAGSIRMYPQKSLCGRGICEGWDKGQPRRLALGLRMRRCKDTVTAPHSVLSEA